jgi:hypothetical protein
MWTPGRVAAAFATGNGDPNKIPPKYQVRPLGYLEDISGGHFQCQELKGSLKNFAGLRRTLVERLLFRV